MIENHHRNSQANGGTLIRNHVSGFYSIIMAQPISIRYNSGKFFAWNETQTQFPDEVDLNLSNYCRVVAKNIFLINEV